MKLLLDYARNEVGVAMGSIDQLGNHVGWTTDKDKAAKLRDAGARTSYYESREPAYSGYEISFSRGAEVVPTNA